MGNLELMAGFEYSRLVGRRSFWISTLSLPLLMFLTMAGGIALLSFSQNDLPLGYVDRSGIFDTAVPPAPNSRDIIPYNSIDAAQEACRRGEIQAYLVIPAAYPHGRAPLQLFYATEPPGVTALADINAFLRRGLTAGAADGTWEAVIRGLFFTIRAADGSQEMGRGALFNLFIPVFAAFLLLMAVNTHTGTLLQVVTDEKVNRTIEVMITSMTPEQLIGGKALGLLGVCLTQIGLWLLMGAAGIVAAGHFFPILQPAALPTGYLLLVLAFFLPTFALIAGIMIGIGGATSELQQGQQIAGVLNLLFTAPFFFIIAI
jgi:ABC-2 type transport system permease protein